MRPPRLSALLKLPIRWQLALVALVLAVPAAFVVVRSGLRAREEAFAEAREDAQKLARDISLSQQNLAAGARQLLLVLAQLPEVRSRDAPRVQAILRDCLALNAQYSNIFVADEKGQVWASAVPAAPFDISDRRYFRNTLQNDRFSSGEFVTSRATGRAAFNLGYPVRDEGDRVVGVLSVGFNLEQHRQLLDLPDLMPGTNYLILDHAGVVLSRGRDPGTQLGERYHPEPFQAMVRGPEAATVVLRSMMGDVRLVAWEKLHLPGEEAPYLYVRVGIPIEAVEARGNAAMASDLAVLVPSFLAALLLALLFAKRALVDRTTQLQRAAERVAAGDLTVRVSDVVVGGELGGLALTFDEMARQVAERERARRLSEALYRQLFEVVSDALFLLDTESGRLREVNPAACRLLGYGREELLSMRYADLSADPETDRATRGRLDGEHVLVERAHRRKDGSLVACEVAAVFFTFDGRPMALAALRDVTARKRAEEERRSLGEELAQSQKMEAIGRLAGGVAHDFNNLLTVIGASCEELQASEALPHALREEVQVIRSSADSAAALTRQLLAFSRKQVLSPRVVDLNEVVRSAERMLRRVIGEDVRLEILMDPHPWRVRTDPFLVEQAVMNLALNARDAMPAGGALRIETANLVVEGSATGAPGLGPGSYVLLRVADTGQGMDRAVAGRIFEPFFTTKPEGRGTGLGLSMVYGIVQQSGGHVEVESAPGLGTSFRLYFPRAAEPAPRPAARPEPHRPPEAAAGTVLVIEDSDGVRQVVRQALGRNGYTVLEARSGEEALEVAARHEGPIRLVVADVVLPGMNGRVTTERLRALRPDLQVLFVSGYHDDALLAAGVQQAKVAFIDKPFTPEQLERKVDELLGAGRSGPAA